MIFTSIINSLFVLFQCAGCSGGPGPCAPCCPGATPPGTGCGGPPPPVGTPIDMYVYVLFVVAIVFGIYTLNKRQAKA